MKYYWTVSAFSESFSILLCTIYFAVPSGSPLMFEVLAEQRQVNFSWSPPPPSQQNGLTTHSPARLPLHPSLSHFLSLDHT